MGNVLTLEEKYFNTEDTWVTEVYRKFPEENYFTFVILERACFYYPSLIWCKLPNVIYHRYSHIIES